MSHRSFAITGSRPPAIDRQRAEGRLHFVTGRLTELTVADGRGRVTVRPRGGATPQSFAFDRAINSTSPECDFRRIHLPLIRSLLSEGTVRVDHLGLGLEVSRRDEIVDGDGRIVSGLFALGPVTRGAYCEMLAVPELRNQAATLARTLTAY